ncbi:helix-turn-helix domain-containing protein [Brachybacterium sp. AOP35-5H-19]|uniref:helix-turn-helix domain-containing protein n=1 Tax=Brachybacterium sp. AOP35-5H-19 TaxID=3457685 RepID=UPI004033BE21
MAEEEPRDRLAAVRWNIARYRSKAGLSQADLAERMTERGLKWFPQTVQKVENGSRTLRFDEAVLLARSLEIELWDLLDQPAEAVAEEIAGDFVDARDRLKAAMSDYLRCQERLAILTDRVGDMGWEPVVDILTTNPLAEIWHVLQGGISSPLDVAGTLPEPIAEAYAMTEGSLMNEYEPEAFGPSPEGSNPRLDELLERRLRWFGTPGEKWAHGVDPEAS